MSQGGEVHFGDTSTSNFLGITEGVVNSFGDYDYISLYYRGRLDLYGNASNTKRFTFDTSFYPAVNNSANLGTNTNRWANIYTYDLNLSNEGKEGGNEVDGTTGNWTIQEGDENLFVINNKTGKKFKMNLTEV